MGTGHPPNSNSSGTRWHSKGLTSRPFSCFGLNPESSKADSELTQPPPCFCKNKPLPFINTRPRAWPPVAGAQRTHSRGRGRCSRMSPWPPSPGLLSSVPWGRWLSGMALASLPSCSEVADPRREVREGVPRGVWCYIPPVSAQNHPASNGVSRVKPRRAVRRRGL